jgi:hypothetical protein
VGAPDLKPEKTPEERRSNNIAGSFEAWARSLEAAGLTFDSTSRRWHLLAQSRSPDKALQIEHLELIYRRSQILIERITYKLDLQRWAKMAQNAAKETFGPRTRAELHNNFNQGQPDGAWLVLEFTRPNSRETSMGYSHLFDNRNFQNGFLALKITPSIVPAGFNVSIGEIAGLGYQPHGVWPKIHRFIRRSMGLSGVARPHRKTEFNPEKDSFELTLGITELIAIKEPESDIKIQLALEEYADEYWSLLANVKPFFDQDGNLIWTSTRSGTNENKSPPGFLPSSHRVAQPTRQPHPVSLKLDRELTPDFEGLTLDAISTMIRKVNLIWPSFESSSIVASVLSEILGDCWASQPPASGGPIDPFQMAKSAWERAGSMRANRLRILRKTAVAARSHGNIVAETIALQEILRLEKRRNNLASAMVRIAQIGAERSCDQASHIDVEKLLLDAANLESDDEQVNFACFNQMVGSGLFIAGMSLGKNLINDPNRIKSAKARADIAITMSQICVSEMKDDASAITYLNEARRSDPSSTRALSEIAIIAARIGNKELEIECLFELADVFFTNGPKENQTVSEFESMSVENNLQIFQRALTDVANQGSGKCSEKLLDTTRTLSLLGRSLDDNRSTPKNIGLWLNVLEKLTLRSDFSILRSFIVRAFLRLCRPDDSPGENPPDPGTITRLTFGLVDPRDVIGGKQILASTAGALAYWNNTGWVEGTSTSEAYAELLEKITLDPANQDWMTEHAQVLFSLSAYWVQVPVIIKALQHNGIRGSDWLRKVVDLTITTHPWQRDPEYNDTDNSKLNQLARISFAATEAALAQNNSARAKEIIFLAISRLEDLIYVFLDSFEAESSPDRKVFLLHALAGATVHALDDGIATSTLNSRIRSMTLAFRPEYRSSQKGTNDPVVKILFESICEDGQSMPLEEPEIEFLLHEASLTPSSGILKCLIHQASFHESPVRASELFKVCLDHAILELNDEALASRIIGAWLTRLQPHRNELIKIPEGAHTSPNTIDQLAAELIQLLDEFDQQSATEIREQLANAGFVTPLDPVPAIAGAYRNGKFDTARNLFRRGLSAASGSEGILALRLYHALDQMDFRAGIKRPDKNTLISLLLDWYSSPAISPVIPVELALLASQHLSDRSQARSIIEKVQARLDVASPEAQSLWIPYYMLLSEVGSKDEVNRYLDKILPGIRTNPALLSNYPFTIESLEAERGFNGFELEKIIPEVTQAGVTSPISETISATPVVDVPTISFELPEAVEVPALSFELPEAVEVPPLSFELPETVDVPPLSFEQPEAVEPSITFALDSPNLASSPVQLPVEAENAVKMKKEEKEEEKDEDKGEGESEQPKEAPSGNINFSQVVPRAPAQEVKDWRDAVRNRKLTHESTNEILASEMPNKIEKHLALQAVAVMRGESHFLERWDWRVWRKPHEYGYSRHGKNRFPPGISPRIMKTPFFRLLLRAAPLLALSFPERFTLKGLAKSLKMSVRQIEAKRQRLNWTTGIAGHAGFGFHSKLFSERGLSLFALQGLGPEIFYDAATSSIYIDDSFFARKPSTHLYHRIMFLLYSIRTQFYPLLNLDPRTQILSELNKLKAVMDRGPLAVLAAQAKITDSRMAKLMKAQDFEEFKQLFGRAGELTEDDIKDSSKSMQQYVWRLLLADSLDLTGIIEAMLDVDLLLPGSVKPGEILLMSSQVDPLINFALALKLEETSEQS